MHALISLPIHPSIEPPLGTLVHLVVNVSTANCARYGQWHANPVTSNINTNEMHRHRIQIITNTKIKLLWVPDDSYLVLLECCVCGGNNIQTSNKSVLGEAVRVIFAKCNNYC